MWSKMCWLEVCVPPQALRGTKACCVFVEYLAYFLGSVKSGQIGWGPIVLSQAWAYRPFSCKSWQPRSIATLSPAVNYDRQQWGKASSFASLSLYSTSKLTAVNSVLLRNSLSLFPSSKMHMTNEETCVACWACSTKVLGSITKLGHRCWTLEQGA